MKMQAVAYNNRKRAFEVKAVYHSPVGAMLLPLIKDGRAVKNGTIVHLESADSRFSHFP
jgi:hypothetical protein